MVINENTKMILDFYNTAELAQKTIEVSLDDWLKGTGTEVFDKLLLNLAELIIQLLRISCSRDLTS